MTTPGDVAVRQRLLEQLDTSFVVEAAAGTGKTTVLVARVVALVQSGKALLERIIAVTFTEKAAGELKLRLRDALERARQTALEPDATHLRHALEQLEAARIGTIHGVCADLLREYPVEAGVDPMFDVAAEDEAAGLFSRAFDRWFEHAVAKPPEGVRRLLRRRPQRSDDEAPRELLRSAAWRLAEHRDFDGAWERPPFARDLAIDAVVQRLERLALHARAYTGEGSSRPSPFIDNLRSVARFVDDLHHRESVRPRDFDDLEAGLTVLARDWNWERAPWKRDTFDGRSTDDVARERDEAFAELKAFKNASEGDLAACLQTELRPILDAYEDEKARAGTLDFVDLLHKTRTLLRTQRAVRAALRRRFSHVFVDEFQDVDPMQVELVLLLASSTPDVDDAFSTTIAPGALFVVGDPKQSIYRFRRADIALYERVKQHLVRQGAQVEYLSTSFRSTPGIQAAVNAAFAQIMTSETPGQAQYVPLEPHRPRTPSQPSLVALTVPHPFNERGVVTKQAVEASTPSAVGAFIEFLLTKSGWTVEEHGARVPVQPRHICVLFKRLRGWNDVDLSRPYAQQLEARGVPHVLVGGRSFHTREEVLALRTALRAIEWPDDELSLFATLRGPFIALDDVTLLAFKNGRGLLHPLRTSMGPWPEAQQAIVDALTLIRRLHLNRNRDGVAQTLRRFLEETRALAGIAFWKAGDQALANVLHFIERCRRFEEGASSFRSVVEQLDDEAEAASAREAPIVEEGTDGVRMMTVHGAKGLEFPVVILAEPTANMSPKRPSHWVDSERRVWAMSLAGCEPWDLRRNEAEVLELDRHEAMRLTYVAATRAKDLLVVPAVADEVMQETWTSVLAPALYPSPESAASPKPAPGCPAFGVDSVVDRAAPMSPHAPRPGLHLASTRTHGVVWWDPATLALEAPEVRGLHVEEALTRAGAADDSIAAYAQWATERRDVLTRAGVAAEPVVKARDVALRVGAAPISEQRTQTDRSSRPRGPRFGALVHAVLSRIAFDADDTALRATAESFGRQLLASPEECVWAARAAGDALRHPLLQAAAAADMFRREAPLAHRRADGSWVEGVVDLAFLSKGTWHVVEFKTDETLDAHREEYVAQTQAYVAAIASATARPTVGTLLSV